MKLDKPSLINEDLYKREIYKYNSINIALLSIATLLQKEKSGGNQNESKEMG